MNTHIENIQGLGYTPSEIKTILSKSSSSMPDDFREQFIAWDKEIKSSRELVDKMYAYVYENDLGTVWSDILRTELSQGIYRGVFGWSPMAWYIRQYMVAMVNDIPDDAAMVEHVLEDLGL